MDDAVVSDDPHIDEIGNFGLFREERPSFSLLQVRDRACDDAHGAEYLCEPVIDGARRLVGHVAQVSFRKVVYGPPELDGVVDHHA